LDEPARSRRRYAASPGKTQERTRRWGAANPEKKRAHSQKWRDANPDQWRESNRRSKQANQHKYTDRQRADYALNPEKYRVVERKRRAQKRNSGGTHTAADLAEILSLQNGKCAYCKIDLKRRKKHVDHIVPLALGGSNGRSNLQYLCAPCNQSKSARDPVTYARSIGLLL
jgi:5-methylcytosine-specific restriction endonuclease McrA